MVPDLGMALGPVRGYSARLFKGSFQTESCITEKSFHSNTAIIITIDHVSFWAVIDILMSSESILQPISLGAYADEILREEGSAWVQGVTSSGIFLHSQNEEILFLTNDPWRGPLTVNLSGSLPGSNLKVGIEVRLAYPQVKFPDFEINITKDTRVWQSDLIKFSHEDYQNITRNAQQLGSAVKFKGQFLPFCEVLNTAADPKINFMEKKARLRTWFSMRGIGEIHNIGKALERFLGSGGGLTPAGDDFIIGYLLVCSSLRLEDKPDFESLLAEAREKTTTLSANLIACAEQGSADERLIGALRFLLEGERDCSEVKKELLSYGSSSGIETLAGMLTAIFLQN